jgi:hypothetical protein
MVLIGALLLPWTETGAVTESGWELIPGPALVCVIAGLAAIGTALTGGRITFFRPDVSLIGAADMFAVASSLMIGWLLAFDLPQGASLRPGAYAALGAAVAVACVVADWNPVFRAMPDADAERSRG